MSILPFPEKNQLKRDRILKKCVTALRESEHPLVSLTTLLSLCGDEAPDLSESELHTWLEELDEVLIVDQDAEDAPVIFTTFLKINNQEGLHAMLKERTPSPEQLMEMVRSGLGKLRESLMTALADATLKKDHKKIKEIENMLERNRIIEETFLDFFG